MTRFILLWLIGAGLVIRCAASPPTQQENPTASQFAAESEASLAPDHVTPVSTLSGEMELPGSKFSPILTSTSEASPIQTQCHSPASLTPSLTEGPYFKTGTPERTSLLQPGMPGEILTLTGYVLTTDCQPVANALLEFWQADANGVYDNSGFNLRGHQFADETGKYSLETIIPGIYAGRTEHIHAKVQAAGGPVLITQLFFPDVPENQSDRIFDASLVLSLMQSNSGYMADFNFIISLR